MKIPLRGLKQRIYKGRVKKYFDAGLEFEHQSETRLELLARNLSLKSREYVGRTLAIPSIRAYHDVQGQLSLIDADIFGLVPGDYKEKDFSCAFAMGQIFYGIKLVDNILDTRQDIPIEDKLKLLYGVNQRVNGDVASVLEILSSCQIQLVNRNLLSALRENAIRSLFSISNSERLRSSVFIGNNMGMLMYDIMSKYYLMPSWSEDFLRIQGETANVFDDLKDIGVDRKRGQGYSLSYMPALMTTFFEGYLDLHKTFPDLEALKRFYSFMTLGIGFQIEEFFGVKSRT